MNMKGSFMALRTGTLQHRAVAGFAVSWCAGLISGTLFAVGADSSLLSLMRLALSCRVSIVLLFLAALFPFLITAYAVCINRFSLLFAAAFVKALAFSYCGALVYRAVGDAGWLLQPMFQFTDTVVCVAYCWFCLRVCMHPVHSVRGELMICVTMAAIAVITDFILVSPFLGTLI